VAFGWVEGGVDGCYDVGSVTMPCRDECGSKSIIEEPDGCIAGLVSPVQDTRRYKFGRLNAILYKFPTKQHSLHQNQDQKALNMILKDKSNLLKSVITSSFPTFFIPPPELPPEQKLRGILFVGNSSRTVRHRSSSSFTVRPPQMIDLSPLLVFRFHRHQSHFVLRLTHGAYCSVYVEHCISTTWRSHL